MLVREQPPLTANGFQCIKEGERGAAVKMRGLNDTRICSAGDGGVVGGCCGQNVLFMHARILTCFANIISSAQR